MSKLKPLLIRDLLRRLRGKGKESWRTKLLKMALGLGLLALCAGLVADHATAGGTVRVRFGCPEKAFVALNWKNEIKRPPGGREVGGELYNGPYVIKDGTHSVAPKFVGIVRGEYTQVITCTYKIDSIEGYYSYTVKRKIRSCGAPLSRSIKCVLEE